MLSVIVPAFNEADNLRRYPAELLPVLAGLDVPSEVIVVDDGSTDATATVAASLGAAVRVVAHPRNLGLGAAVRTGIAEAGGDLLVTIDADLTFTPTLIPKLLERFRKGDVDVVAGSPKLAGYAADVPRYRIAVSHASSLVYSSLLGVKITAVTPILRLYRVADLRELTLESVGFDINAEILFGLIRKGRRVAEIPAPLTQRLHGESHLDYRREVRRHLRLVRKMLSWRLGFGGRSTST
jgi:glycosyltransferase involved in cell wall biosynthesis